MPHFTFDPSDPESLKKLASLIADTMRSIDSIAMAMVILGKTFDLCFEDGERTIGRECLTGLVTQLDKPLMSCHFSRCLRTHLDGTSSEPTLELLDESIRRQT
jgi:hypothetical protein